jgi:prepilin-type N-terminal cleavage/methylation domain-containing protein
MSPGSQVQTPEPARLRVAPTTRHPPCPSPLAPRSPLAFTLIELMVVLGIMALIMAIGVPIVYKASQRVPMSQAITGVIEVCSRARAQAVLQGREVDLIIYPRESRFEVGAAAAPAPSDAPASFPSSLDASGPASAPSAPASGSSLKLSDRVVIELLDINKLGHEFRDDDSARVRFFPNGTCDELSLVLLFPERGERREITLEVTTGLASVETDVRKFH